MQWKILRLLDLVEKGGNESERGGNVVKDLIGIQKTKQRMKSAFAELRKN